MFDEDSTSQLTVLHKINDNPVGRLRLHLRTVLREIADDAFVRMRLL